MVSGAMIVSEYIGTEQTSHSLLHAVDWSFTQHYHPSNMIIQPFVIKVAAKKT